MQISNQFFCWSQAPVIDERRQKKQRKKTGDPPTTQASSAAARSSCPQVASRAQGSKGGKNKITNNEGGAPIIVVKLLRTDTTLDLSQKARVVKNRFHFTPLYILADIVHGPFSTWWVMKIAVHQYLMDPNVHISLISNTEAVNIEGGSFTLQTNIRNGLAEQDLNKLCTTLESGMFLWKEYW